MTTPVGDPDQLEALDRVDLIAMLDRLSDGILVLADDWTIEYINQPVGEMIGRPHWELLGRNNWQEFPEAVGGPFQLAYEEARRTGRPQRVVDHYEPLAAWFETKVLPQADKLIGLVRDVTALQHIEHDLRQFGDGVAEAERIVHFGVWRWDVASGGVRCSDELQRIYGLRPASSGEASTPGSSSPTRRTESGSGATFRVRSRRCSPSCCATGSSAPTLSSGSCSPKDG